jgi:hypothetical protein
MRIDAVGDKQHRDAAPIRRENSFLSLFMLDSRDKSRFMRVHAALPAVSAITLSWP